MSSSPLGSHPGPAQGSGRALLRGWSPRTWSPRTWSMRSKLVVAILALFSVVCLVVGTVSTVALHRFLLYQLDRQVVEGDRRAFGGPGPPERGLGGRELVPLGQPVGSVGALVIDGQVHDAVVLSPSAGGYHVLRRSLSPEQRAPLADLPTDTRAHTVSLADLGNYRLIARPLSGGGVLVTGLPLSTVNETVWRLVVIETVVAGLGLLFAAVAATTIVRVSLRPLSRVAATAGRVAELPLAKGEVDLRVRVPETDTDPRTEVGQVGAALNRMLGHVATALAARQASETRVRQFVADASHELRTPLAAIRGYAELTRRGPARVPADVAHALGRIESESARMTTLVDDLLLLARLDSGRPLDRSPVELSHLVVDSVNDAHVAGRDHRWLLDLPDEPVTVPGDAARLHQVLANLLANARTHTPPGSTVTTTLTTTADTTTPGLPGGAWAVMSVTDNGPGIPQELLPGVFERFVRAEASRSRAAGSTGLGLAIVAAVVDAHGGRVAVTSGPGRTSFVVCLPGAERA